MANKVSIKNKDRCRFYNMQPQYGDLETARESRIIRYELIDKLSPEQLQNRGISVNAMGQYEVTPEQANNETDMTLSNESLSVWKGYINKTSAKGLIYYADEPLFSQILEMEEEEGGK